ncbi:MAG: extracellular solute-binding protein [Chloroflexota bacterium]|nr:extracellular solute-binding protein [Chloroflexota bacterium]
MSKKTVLLVVIAALLVGAIMPVAAQAPVTVTWFIGLGTGTQPEQQAVEQQVVADFNASRSDIQIELIIAASNQVAPDTLSTLIAGGTPPDIVGPVGFSGANLFAGQWLDLQPLVDATGYDLTQYSPALVSLYQTSEGLVGIPFAVYPSLLFYNLDLFDEAELNYPPSEFGAPYVMPDGTEVPWDWDTVANIAQFLTVDSNGNDASSPDFDPAAVEQFGFNQQWGTLRTDMSTFGGADFWNSETNEVSIPDYWRAQLQWTWDGVWTKRFSPTATYDASALFTPSAFASSRVAMARVPLWYTCCTADMTSAWDLAVVPSYNGEYFSPTDADTNRILASTDTPEEAFEVLTYLQGEAASALLGAYGAFPADPALQEAAVQDKVDAFPSVTHWDVIVPSLDYAAQPNHESWNPGYAQTQQRFNDLRTLIYGDTGADIDLNAEIDRLESDLQTLIDTAVASS